MTSLQDDANPVPASPVAVPHWPGQRHVDVIERSLRQLGPARRDGVLDALAHALDRHLIATGAPRIGGRGAGLDAELDEVLRCLGPLSLRAVGDAGTAA
ncbi:MULTISPECIES: hypothetical protein [unclassified Lysobacter]|uniref:hypothetical protein n=1 Tax=unclassified Lysobacter TaxID=2635362 RepID=UPI001C237711|nr:hypothetical protein [Lysobacter sp. MMG2]MBU8976509.1 hypothetical protein [Lysobacter sp. MMG2]